MESHCLSHQLAAAVAERKALDVVVIDVRGRCSYADYLVLASGTSDTHVQSIAQGCELSLKRDGMRSIGREGFRAGQWALLDFGDVVLHVFHTFTRQNYDLDGLWSDAPRVPFEQPSAEAPPPRGLWAPAG